MCTLSTFSIDSYSIQLMSPLALKEVVKENDGGGDCGGVRVAAVK